MSKIVKIKPPPKKQIHTMDVILIIVGITLLLFTVGMIIVFLYIGSVPDTLITCVFAALGGECGVMGWIRTAKEKNKKKEEYNDDT